MMEFNLEGRFAISRLGKAVAETLSRPGARQDFEEWYRKTYGKEYVWKTKEEYLEEICNK